MAASNVEIVNLALSKVGSATIADWNEATKEGRTATAVFTNVREWLQERYPWNFCLTRVSLTFSNATGTNYSNEYTYYSALTNLSNMLRVYEVDNNPLVSYAIENDNFYTSTTPLVIRYIKKSQTQPYSLRLLLIALPLRWLWRLRLFLQGTGTQGLR